MDELTPREAEVLECMARGDTGEEAAETLFMSRNTVYKRTMTIMSKMGAKNLRHAIFLAIERGWIELKEGESNHVDCERLPAGIGAGEAEHLPVGS